MMTYSMQLMTSRIQSRLSDQQVLVCLGQSRFSTVGDCTVESIRGRLVNSIRSPPFKLSSFQSCELLRGGRAYFTTLVRTNFQVCGFVFTSFVARNGAQRRCKVAFTFFRLYSYVFIIGNRTSYALISYNSLSNCDFFPMLVFDVDIKASVVAAMPVAVYCCESLVLF